MVDFDAGGFALDRAIHVATRQIDRLRDRRWEPAADCVAVEEPLAIVLSHVVDGVRTQSPLTITMRTPGRDFDLAAGFLFGEGIISGPEDIEDIARPAGIDDEDARDNTVVVTLRAGIAVELSRQQRAFVTSSSCGVCGKASLDALVIDGCRPLEPGPGIDAATIQRLPATLREAQGGFSATGGVHACGLFTPEGELRAVAEDVGRHNAFDKLVGAHVLAGTPDELAESAVLLSGRASFELLQKALHARIPIVAAIGAPSSLAVEIAETFGMTLAGFVKPGGFNVYAGRDRIRG